MVTTLKLEEVYPTTECGDYPTPGIARLVCISDTHGKHWDIQVPAGMLAWWDIIIC